MTGTAPHGAVGPTAYVEHYQGARRQTWTTPRSLFDELDREFHFTFDGAADEDNALLPEHESVFYRPWTGQRVFCNPPWSNIPPFVELAPTAAVAVLLVPARTNARWFHRALELGAQVRFFKGRPRFGDGAGSSPIDCVLLLFGEAACDLKSDALAAGGSV